MTLTHLTPADRSGNRKPEHDIHFLKKIDYKTRRQSALKGKKVLFMWDKAGIDFIQWLIWKYGAGTNFVSRKKENVDLLMMKELPFDKKIKSMQAQFKCLAHKLMSILEKDLQKNGIENKKEDDRRQARLGSDLSSRSGIKKEKLPSFLKTPQIGYTAAAIIYQMVA